MASVGKRLRAKRDRDRKHSAELAFWRRRLAEEGTLGAGHYHWFFTVHQGLEPSFYEGKRMLDVGCGPRGSLEWATGAARRVGADPLAGAYQELGTAAHAMEYVEAGAESLPFADGAFDVVSCFNALDHVDDPGAALAEIARVLAPGGLFLVIVEIEGEPTIEEPHKLRWDVLEQVTPPLRVESERRYRHPGPSVYEVLIHTEPLDAAAEAPSPGLLSARLRR
jgi:SAM-dependent methyltransferase